MQIKYFTIECKVNETKYLPEKYLEQITCTIFAPSWEIHWYYSPDGNRYEGVTAPSISFIFESWPTRQACDDFMTKLNQYALGHVEGQEIILSAPKSIGEVMEIAEKSVTYFQKPPSAYMLLQYKDVPLDLAQHFLEELAKRQLWIRI